MTPEEYDALKARSRAVYEHFGTSPPYVKARLGWRDGLPDDIHEYTANKVIQLIMEALYAEQAEQAKAVPLGPREAVPAEDDAAAEGIEAILRLFRALPSRRARLAAKRVLHEELMREPRA